MTPDDVERAFLDAGFCGVERDGAQVYARIAAQAPEFRAEETEGGWRLVLPWNVRPPVTAMEAWNENMGFARMQIIAGEAALVMPLGDLAQWAALAAEAEAHFILWRRARRPAEGM
ncbi:hypothetical protein [Gemmobacter serpentinus]|uniref:hypothetical protein n=1 Tax=Gemmobacter serpentinus TaxID=2652247 RepID=UPI00124BD972|nr:hypothetical protein [Gemmobacter serpentinus]